MRATLGRVLRRQIDRRSAPPPAGILCPASKLQHQLPLASAYAAVASAPDDDHAVQRQKRRLEPTTGEPRFTNITRDFKGALDYILYTRDSLVPSAALELPDESEIRTRSNAGERPLPQRSAAAGGLQTMVMRMGPVHGRACGFRV